MTIRILIVEDETDIRKGIAIELSHSSEFSTVPDIIEADDVDAALLRLSECAPVHVVLTDLMMPSGKDAGLHLIETMRQHLEWRRIPIIALSARAQAGDILAALKSGAMDYVVKPFDPLELTARVVRALEFSLALQPNEVACDAHDKRKRWVDAMKTAVLYWELATQRNKVQLADESGLWRVYIDNRGTCSTKTLDKYLHIDSLPANPKLHIIEKTLHFVLARCQGHENLRTLLLEALDPQTSLFGTDS